MSAAQHRRGRLALMLASVLACLAVLVLVGRAFWKEDGRRRPLPAPIALRNNMQRLEDVSRVARAVGIDGLVALNIERFRVRLRRYPNSIRELVERPDVAHGGAAWDGPYIHNERLLADAWGQPYRYRSPGLHNQDSYDVWSIGPDAIDGTADDIGNWLSGQRMSQPRATTAGSAAPRPGVRRSTDGGARRARGIPAD